MKKIILATAASAALFAAAPAFAQTAPAGARVELLVGYDKVKALGESDDGLLFGIGGGYDFAAGNSISVGVDAELSDSTQKESEAGAEVKAGRDLYAGGRVNFAVTEAANLYLKAGYTNARFKATDGAISAAENFDGVRLGAGGQIKVKGNSYLGGEYRYSDYQDGLKRHQLALTVGTRF